MATLAARQPFAPLNEARLHTLTSLKNRQNAMPSPSPVKRKASEVAELDDSENVDPVLFSKRAKGADGFFPSKDSLVKPSTFLITKSAGTMPPALSSTSPAARSSPLSVSGGRSLTRKRSGGLRSSRRRNGSSLARVDPPLSALPKSSAVAPFSLDAALRGTISSYTRSNISSKKSLPSPCHFSGLYEPQTKSSWHFDIHEDTIIEHMTNDLNHKTSGLDLMSEEQKLKKLQEEWDEGKENHPPLDDISQTPRQPRAARPSHADEMVVEKERSPLREMDPRDFYAEGYDENSIVMVPGDDEEVASAQNDRRLVAEVDLPVHFGEEAEAEAETDSIVAPAPQGEQDRCASVEELMQKTDQPAPGAAVLAPLEGTGETFEVWESSSAKDDTEAVPEC